MIYYITEQEEALLDAITRLEYGEMFGVEVLEQKADVPAQYLTQNQHAFIEFIREGHNYIDVLKVHQGEPVGAECDFKLGAFRCRKKTKFPK